MHYVVSAARMDGQPVAVVRRRASARELSAVVPAACGEVWSCLRAHGVTGAGRHVAIYYDDAITLEVGAEVPGTFAGAGEVVRSSTPSGLVATAVHVGPYDRLGGAHEAIRAWCAQQGYRLAGPNWEIYGHWTDDTAPRTDVFYLLVMN